MKNLLLIFGLLLSISSYSQEQDFEVIKELLEEIEQQNLELRNKVMPTVKEFRVWFTSNGFIRCTNTTV